MDDIEYLKTLSSGLYPDLESLAQKSRIQAQRELTAEEVERVFSIIEKHKLLTSMFCANKWMGGYGIEIFEHPHYPGTPPVSLLFITEYDLPKELNSQYKQPTGGKGSDDAWEMFSKFTHSQENIECLKRYGMRKSESRNHYDY